MNKTIDELTAAVAAAEVAVATADSDRRRARRHGRDATGLDIDWSAAVKAKRAAEERLANHIADEGDR